MNKKDIRGYVLNVIRSGSESLYKNQTYQGKV